MGSWSAEAASSVDDSDFRPLSAAAARQKLDSQSTH